MTREAKPLFTTGASVKVKAGVRCPDYPKLAIGGWQGRITEVEKAEDDSIVVLIQWDSVTLKAIPEKFIADSEKEGCAWAEMYLDQDDVEPAAPRDSDKEARDVGRKLEEKAFWLSEGKVGAVVVAAIGKVDSKSEMALFEAWMAYLKTALSFPFEAKVSEPQEGPRKQGDKVTVLAIEDETDDLYGVLVAVKSKRTAVFPLCELAVTDRKSPNWLPVEAYRTWFANR